MNYLGLADLGKTVGDDLDTGYDYEQDGDNYVDICLDLSGQPTILEEGLNLELLCDENLENSVLYPPKGKPYGCKNQNVLLTKTSSMKFILNWL